MERWAAKLTVFAIIFSSTFLATILPLKISNYFQRQGKRGIHLLSYFTCFGGGVFLAMYMIEMAPDAAKLVQKHISEPHDIDYNIAEFVTSCGFLLMLVMEIAIARLQGGTHSHNPFDKGLDENTNHTAERGIQCSLRELNFFFNNTCVDKQLRLSCELLPNTNCDELNVDVDKGDLVCREQNDYEDVSYQSLQERSERHSQRLRVEPDIATDTFNDVHTNRKHNYNDEDCWKALVHAPTNTDSKAVPLLINVGFKSPLGPIPAITSKDSLAAFLNIGLYGGLIPAKSIGAKKVKTLQQLFEKSEKKRTPMKTTTHRNASRSIILLIALSLHHIFEGLSIGLKTNTSAVWHMCICLVSHELIISFSLGMQLIATFRSRLQVVIASALCSIVTPVGIVLGMIIMETGSGDSELVQIVNGLLQSIATGIFIYVTFFEILQDELNRPSGSNVIKVASVICGFLMISAFGLMPKEEDDDLDRSFFSLSNSTNINDTLLSTL